MRAFARLVLIGQLGLCGSFAGAVNLISNSVDRDSYTFTASWMHAAPGTQTGIRVGDLQIVRTSTGQTETAGSATLVLVGVLPNECREMAIQSATGLSQVTLFTDSNSARFEIRDTPTYVIDVKNIRSCGIRIKSK